MNEGLISRRTSRKVFLGVSWLGILLETAFVAPVLSQYFRSDGEYDSFYVLTFAPLTLSFGLISLVLFSWWMANRHAGVPCYKEVKCISIGHSLCVASVVIGGLYVILTPSSDQFLAYAIFAPLLGETAVLIGMIAHTIRLRINKRPKQDSSCDRTVSPKMSSARATA